MTRRIEQDNMRFIGAETDWLARLIDLRISLHGENDSESDILALCPPPLLGDHKGIYASTLKELGASSAERLAIVLALAQTVSPQLLDPFLINNKSIGRRFTEFGGVVAQDTGNFTPTVQTALFLLAGTDIARRLGYFDIFRPDQKLTRRDILICEGEAEYAELTSYRLDIMPEGRELLLYKREFDPPFSSRFPAEKLETNYEWDDLVLPGDILDDVCQIRHWIEYEGKLMNDWGLSRRLVPGYRCLFDGPPGTGKTLTASLLGKAMGRTVYRIDISRMVSKYIGETEKNMASLFDRARGHKWILFFDEADALFGKRGDGGTTSERTGNQNVAYLLQRIESFDGLVILASNLPENIDDAFSRRFQSIVHFRKPGIEERHMLWTKNFGIAALAWSDDIDFRYIAREYELTGGEIVNILRYAYLMAAAKGTDEVKREYIMSGIRKEQVKAGRFF